MNEYRATHKAAYDNPGCPGHTNPRARQGYYVCADNILTASIKAYNLITNTKGYYIKPEDCEIELWKENIQFPY